LFGDHDLTGLAEADLLRCFDRLYRTLAKKVSKTGERFFFVVDGLDHVPTAYGSNSIFTYLPTSLPDGIFLLLSSKPGRTYSFKYDRLPIPLFSLPETQSILGPYLSTKEISAVYEESGGMPGYVGEVYRQLCQGKPAREVISNLPKQLRGFIERECDNVDENPRLRKMLAVMAYSFSDLDVATLAEICGESQESVRSMLLSTTFITEDPTNSVLRFVTNAHRSYLREHFEPIKGEIQRILIAHYEKDPLTEKSAIQLPILYSRSGKYDSLVELLKPDSIAKVLSATHNASLVLGNLHVLSECALAAKDWNTVAYSSLADTVLRLIIQRPPPLEGEIEALLEMGLYDEAVSAASSCGFPQDQLYLLSKTCRIMGQRQIVVPESLVSLITQTAEKVPSLTEMGTRVFDVITDLFVALPDIALQLVERLRIERTGSSSVKGHLLDDFLTDLSLSLSSHPEEDDALPESLPQESLIEFLRIASTDFETLSQPALFSKVERISDTSAKVFFLLAWLHSHLDDAAAVDAVRKVLQILTESTDYPPTLRRLRQVAEIVCDLKAEPEVKREIVERLDLLKSTAAAAPKEEAVRVNLLIAQAERSWSQDAADLRLYELYLGVDEIADLDMRCLVLAHIATALPALRPWDQDLHDEVLDRLQNEFRDLLERSAEQWFAARKIIGTLAGRDEALAVEMAKMLNTSSRRDAAFEHVLRVYTTRDVSQIRTSFILSVLREIQSTGLRERTLVNVLRRVSRTSMFRDTAAWEALRDYAENLQSPVWRIYGKRQIASTL